ncbi:MAG: hypothetical protein QM775_09815 [Pirellulales bacterium]
MANEGVDKLDKESIDQLEQVRKGKPRKFVMVTKGTNILNLIVFKKGTYEKYRKQALSAGPGQICTGIVEGKGPEITFKISETDGFSKEPVKAMTIRTFLEEKADYKCKPSFEVVPSHGPMLDEDDPLVQRFLSLQTQAEQIAKTDASRAADLRGLCTQIATDLDQDQSDAATTKLKTLEQMLGGSAAAPAASAAPTATAAPTAADAAAPDAKVEFMTRLKQLKPGIDEVKGQDSPAAQQVAALAGQVGDAAREGHFAEGLQLLDQLAEALKQTDAGGGQSAPEGKIPLPPPPPPPTAPDKKIAAALRFLAAKIAQTSRSFPEQKAAIAGLKSDVEKALAAGNPTAADTALKSLEKLMSSLGGVSPEAADEFHDQWDAAVDAWDDAVAKSRDQLAQLQSHLAQTDDEDLQNIGEFGLGAVTQSHLVPLSAALLELDSAPADQLKTAARRVKTLISEFRKHVETSEIVKACDENPFGIAVSLRTTLKPGFDALEQGLAAVTSA